MAKFQAEFEVEAKEDLIQKLEMIQDLVHNDFLGHEPDGIDNTSWNFWDWEGA